MEGEFFDGGATVVWEKLEDDSTGSVKTLDNGPGTKKRSQDEERVSSVFLLVPFDASCAHLSFFCFSRLAQPLGSSIFYLSYHRSKRLQLLRLPGWFFLSFSLIINSTTHLRPLRSFDRSVQRRFSPPRCLRCLHLSHHHHILFSLHLSLPSFTPLYHQTLRHLLLSPSSRSTRTCLSCRAPFLSHPSQWLLFFLLHLQTASRRRPCSSLEGQAPSRSS